MKNWLIDKLKQKKAEQTVKLCVEALEAINKKLNADKLLLELENKKLEIDFLKADIISYQSLINKLGNNIENAKTIIKNLLTFIYHSCDGYSNAIHEAEEFIKETE